MRVCSIMLLLFMSLSGWAGQYSPFYNKVASPKDTGLPSGTVQVLGFFSYACPTCQEVESQIKAWVANADNVKLEWVASPKGYNAEPLSYAYYASLDMPQQDQIHTALYKAAKDNPFSLRDMQGIAEFLAEETHQDPFSVEIAMDSLAVRSGHLYAKQLAEEYNIVHLPAFVINGKYITHNRLADTAKQIVDVVNHLVTEETK